MIFFSILTSFSVTNGKKEEKVQKKEKNTQKGVYQHINADWHINAGPLLGKIHVKPLKNIISTSKQHAKHPFADQNAHKKGPLTSTCSIEINLNQIFTFYVLLLSHNTEIFFLTLTNFVFLNRSNFCNLQHGGQHQWLPGPTTDRAPAWIQQLHWAVATGLLDISNHLHARIHPISHIWHWQTHALGRVKERKQA